MNPRISVVMPCYNVAAYVTQAVQSVLDQTYTDFEVVCVDDGSTDATPDILADLATRDNRIRIIRKDNTGYGNTMNVGFKQARGDYLAILEPDDFMDATMLETLYELVVAHHLDFAKCNYFYYRTAPVERNAFCNQIHEDECGFVFRPLDMPRVFFAQPSIWAALYRADFIRFHAIRFNETPGASFQDTSFNFETWLRAQRVYVAYDALVHYRRDNESSSVWDKNKAFCVCDEYARIHAMVDGLDNASDADMLRHLLPARKFSTYLWNYERLEPDVGLQFLYRVQDEYRMHASHGELDWGWFPTDRPELEPALRAIMGNPLQYHLAHTAPEGESFAHAWQRASKAGGVSAAIQYIHHTRGN